MKIKSSELIDAALDWAVAKCLGMENHLYIEITGALCFQSRHWSPSTDWAHGGPIIGKEKISIFHHDDETVSAILFREMPNSVNGSSPLIAAMRCYVTYKLGAEIDVPEEIILLTSNLKSV